MTALYQLDNIRFAYTEDTVLDIKNQEFKQGYVTALVGANGCGKSTLLKLLAFLLSPDCGEIRFAGKTVNKKHMGALRKKVGLVPQNPYLIKGNVTRNVELGLKFHRLDETIRNKRVKSILELLGIEHLANRHVSSLSGGEAQKVALARMLVLEPEVVLLDEPFTYLDRTFIEEFEKLIQQLRDEHNKTIIFTSHNRLQSQALANHTYSLVNGDLIEASLSNLFKGYVHKTGKTFDTGRCMISIPSGYEDCKHIAIDPNGIVLSKIPLDSSMRNSYHGEITGIVNENGQVNVIIQAEERFYAHITRDALNEMNLQISDTVYLSFKSSSVHLF